MTTALSPASPDEWQRVIGHADMDAFYAAVEILDNPSLSAVPLAVGGQSRRSVVTTANYVARQYGVGSAMPMVIAKRRCPDLVIVPIRMDRYKEVSQMIMAVFQSYSDTIQPLSLDEAFLDLTETARTFATPHALGQAIKADVFEATGGLTVSVGISSTKSVAKIASDFQKPNGLTVVYPGDVERFLAPLPVERIWGVGPKAAERLKHHGLQLIQDIQTADESTIARLGELGRHCKRLAHGDDGRPVQPRGRSKSIGWERTLSQSIHGRRSIETHLEQAAEGLVQRLERGEWRAGGVRLKLKDDHFKTITRQATLQTPSRDPKVLLAVACRLIDEVDVDLSYRLIGLSAFALVHKTDGLQLPLDLRAEL